MVPLPFKTATLVLALLAAVSQAAQAIATLPPTGSSTPRAGRAKPTPKPTRKPKPVTVWQIVDRTGHVAHIAGGTLFTTRDRCVVAVRNQEANYPQVRSMKLHCVASPSTHMLTQ